MIRIEYDRAAVVGYAHRWAYDRNLRYKNFDRLGGDCTNFASQCLYAGTGVMNFTPTFGWYYRSEADRAPAWTGVPYFFQFLTRKEPSLGPFGREAALDEVRPGDFLQLGFKDRTEFSHNPVVVEVGTLGSPSEILLASHSQDSDFRPLSTYDYDRIRCIHILGCFS